MKKETFAVTRSFAAKLAATAALVLLVNGEVRAQSEDPVVFALSARHFSATAEELEQAAGGEDQLVEKLLQLRTQESPPFVGIRAEKLLLNYAGRDDVQQALAGDLQSPQYLGLARVVAVHIDQIPDAAARQSLARIALSRAQRDADFRSYTRSLRDSSDAEVRALARSQQPE